MKKKDLSKSIGYFRLSTENQLDDYHSFDAYMDRFLKFGFPESKILYDIASGKDNTRVNYQKILTMVKNKEIENVYVPEISRLSRSVGGFEEALEYFSITGVNLITLDGHRYKFETPMDRTNVRLLVLFATQEREMNAYRANKGLDYLRSQGRAIQGVFPYLNEDGKLVPNTKKYKNTNKTVWNIGKEVVETYLAVQTLSGTLEILIEKYGKKENTKEDFPHDVSGLKRWLTRESMRGNIEYFGNDYKYKKYTKNKREPIIIYNTHEPLISEEEYKQIKTLLKIGKKSKHNGAKLRNLWVGKLFCYCGSPMYVHSNIPKQKFYILCKASVPCNNTSRVKQKLGIEKKCECKGAYGLTLDRLDEIVIEGLCKRAEEIANTYFPEEDSVINPEVEALNKQIDKYQILAEDDPDLIPVLNKKIQRREYLINQQQVKSVNQLASLRKKLIIFGSDRSFWMMATPAEKKLLYQDFIDRITCWKGDVSIQFSI